MAHGSPDWHQLSDVDILAQTVGDIHINVAGQDLSEIINRPTYGGALRSNFSVAVGTSGFAYLTQITGTGIIYGGYIYVNASYIHNTDTIRLYLDDQIIMEANWLYLKNYRPQNIRSTPFTIEVYDTVDGLHLLSINRDYTFEASAKLWYSNGDAVDSVTVQGNLYYATI